MISMQGLTRIYGTNRAVDNITLEVDQGEIFGFLGPNGAGKTTTVRMLTGVIEPSGGRATVAGYDIIDDPLPARRNLGIVPEQANAYLDLSVWRNLALMAELHGIPRQDYTPRGRELLERFGLIEKQKVNAWKLSKGQCQRLMICMAMISEPALLFLDEPTSGLDPASSKLIREIVSQDNQSKGTTVFLTTHNMQEAEDLCHRVAIINKGKIMAVDTPRALSGRIDALKSVEIRFNGQSLPEDVLQQIETVQSMKTDNGTVRLFTPSPGLVAQKAACLAEKKGLALEVIKTCEPNLEDVFFHLTES
jgi:ABC-2 type transport system ATP-binding protein